MKEIAAFYLTLRTSQSCKIAFYLESPLSPELLLPRSLDFFFELGYLEVKFMKMKEKTESFEIVVQGGNNIDMMEKIKENSKSILNLIEKYFNLNTTI